MKIRRLLAMLLVISMLGTYLPAGALEFDTTGSAGDNAIWTYHEDDTLVFSGSGALEDGDDHTRLKWAFYSDVTRSIVFEEGITYIGEYLLNDAWNYPRARTITIPASVTRIGEYAFLNTRHIHEVYIADLAQWFRTEFANDAANPLNHGADLYVGNVRLEDLVIPKSVSVIGEYAFKGCGSLETVVIPDHVTGVGSFAFNSCPNLTKIVFQGNAPAFGDNIFTLTDVYAYYPAGNATWTDEVMQSCGESVTWIPYDPASDNVISDAFPRATAQPWVRWDFDDSTSVLTIFGSGDMREYYAGTTNVNQPPWDYFDDEIVGVVIQAGITSIGRNAFSYHTQLESVSIPSTVTEIDDSAFGDCRALKEITLPDGLVRIGNYAFEATALERVEIPATVKEIGAYALDIGGELKEVVFLGSAPEVYRGCLAGRYWSQQDATAYYPAGNPTWTEEVRSGCQGTVTWVAYEPEGDYPYNWGIRGNAATKLSDAAEAFYADNGISYEILAAYAGSSNLSSVPGSELYTQLKDLMIKNHKTITDDQTPRSVYAHTDSQNGGGAISSFYSGKAIGPAWDSGDTWDLEHIWPGSKGLEGNGENDIMMLRPMAKSENGSRGDAAYGESSGYYQPNTASGGAYDVRGDVARSFLYGYVRYGSGDYDAWGTQGIMESKEVLLKWMEQDPVDTWELGRNDVVQSITCTRNVFVDYPELAFLLFGEEVPVMVTPSGNAAEKSGLYYGRDQLARMVNFKALLFAYDQIAAGVDAGATEINIYNGETPLHISELNMVCNVYYRDYAHHFWVDYFSHRSPGEQIYTINPAYTVSGGELAAARAAVEAEVDEILSGISPAMSDYEKELYLHDTLAARIEYVDGANAHNIYGALVEGKAVCEGYAEAFQYLLQRCGIQSFIIEGKSDNEPHAWNAVNIGGKWFHVDVTWDDQGDELYHAYFNLTDARIKEDHVIYSADYDLPKCNSEAAFYFTGKDTLLDTYDTASVGKLLKENNGKVHVYIPGDVDVFLSWYENNIVEIAQAAGVTGGFSYGYSRLGRELILSIKVSCTHNYGSMVIPPSCTEKGYTTYICILCGHSYQDNFVNATGHTETVDQAVAPSCTESGWTEGKHCSVCGEVIIAQSVVPATGHNHEAVVTAPTCNAQGYTTHTCHCGDSYKDNFVNATGIHTYSGTSDTDCDVCGAVRDLDSILQMPFTEAEWEVLKLTNEQREAAGLKPLTGYALLQKAGDIRAEELGQQFSHYRPNGTVCFTVLDELGINKNGAAAENIASGYTTPAKVVNAWMNSQGHRENILTPDLGHMTVGNIGTDWVQMFTGAAAYTDIQVYLPEALSVDPGVSIDALNLVAILTNSTTGECYLPLRGSHCQGYNPNVPGDQTVTVSVLGVTTTFAIHVHDWQSGGCVAEKVCALCGKTDGAAGSHVYGEWTVTAAPTCTEKGSERRDCATCDHYETREIPAKGHTEVIDKAVAATCTESGLTEGKHCSVCGIVLVKQNVVPAKGHSWDGGEVTRVPTEETEGEKVFTCTACGETRTEVIPALDHVHDYKSVVTAPTCTEKGYTTHTCRCGDSYTDSYVDAKGHTEVTDKAVAPTCTTTGLTEGKHCSVCGMVLVKQNVIPAKGHSWDGGEVTRVPTEETEGEKVFTCTACGETRTEVIPALDHVHDYKSVVTAPTCTEKGYTTHTCRCGESYTDSYVDAKGHTEVTDKAVAATCTETGLTEGKHCSECGMVLAAQTVVPAKGHSHEAVVTAPTCTEEGYTTYTCHCGDSYVDSITPAAGHSYGDWETVTEPTCTEKGEKKQTCVSCGDTLAEVIPARGHSWDGDTCTVCGEVQTGYRIELDGADLTDVTHAWVDGKKYPVTFDGTGAFVNIPNTDATNLVIYTFNDPNAADIHTQYPTAMRVWMLDYENGAYTATYVPEFDNLLQYSGSSIRIVGVKGIRMITSIDKDVRNSLINGGLAGYTLVEYGTALAWVSDLDENNPLVLGREYTKSNFAYKRGEADPIFARVGNLIQYTNVLVGFNDDQCIPDIAMRPYIILEDAEGQQITVYGGEVTRSIGYIAWQNRNVFQPGNAAYDYVWGIIHHVYGDKYDEDFKG